ncbi:MAG: DEAD/DEAH box helicase, partial [candidate division WOR-3 bacterium]
MSGVLTALEELPRQSWFRGQVVRVEPLASRAPEYSEPDPALPEPLARYLESEGISALYSHQVELLAAARRGGNVIITTGTASGKTLGFNLPVAEKLLHERDATALYLYPMKAVTQDQLKVLKRLEETAGIRLRPDIYDGDTPQDRRTQVRRTARIVLSNPYELHQILPWHYQWQKFLSGLRFVVVDEAHRYRGVFGSNVAQLLRRFRRLCRLYGSSPQFILASASIANPAELARNLVGLDFTHIGTDGSPRGRSWLVLFNPLSDPETSAYTQVSRLVAHLCRFDLQTLCFVVSRRAAELISRWIREQTPDLPVAAYRAGYLPEDRRAIEADFAAGRLRGVVSTEALELGINVGSLDAIVTFGWPHTLASFWQQAGRAGRRLQDSLVVFVAFADALDQFLLRHPERILDRHFESAVVDLTNPYILKGHLACAASETPLRDEELDAVTAPLARELEQAVILRRTPAGLVYSGTDRPHERVQLDAIEAHSIEVVCEGRVIETIDRSRAFREAYPGAVMLHMGETYLVKSLDLKAGRAEVEPAEVDWFTQVVQHEEL